MDLLDPEPFFGAAGPLPIAISLCWEMPEVVLPPPIDFVLFM